MIAQWFRSLRRLARPVGAARHRFDGTRRHPARLLLETLENRLAPAASVVAASFFDSAVYEINTSTGAVINTLIAPNSQGTMSFPAGMTAGPDGNLYFSSQSLFNPTGNSIVQYNVSTGTLTPFIDASVLQDIATSDPINLAAFAPAGLRFGPDGNLYVSLNGGQGAVSGGTVVRFGIESTGGTLSYDNTSTIIASGLVQPTEMTFGTSPTTLNTLYVSNSGGGIVDGNVMKIDRADSATPTVSTFIASGAGTLNYPAGLTFGPDGSLYVVDVAATATRKGQILRFSANGTFQNVFTTPANSLLNQFPADAVFTDDGKFLTANLGLTYPALFGGPGTGGSIYQFTANGSFVKVLSASAFPAQPVTVPGGATFQVTNFSPSQLALNMGNHAPTVSAGNNFTINEKTSLILHATGADQDGDSLTYAWDINGDGTYGDVVGANVTLTWAQLQAMGLGSSNLTVKVLANDGHSQVATSEPLTVTINRVPATLKITGVAKVNEEAVYRLTLAGKAAPGRTIAQWTINWGDGTNTTISGNPTSATHVYAAGPNKFTISATALDSTATLAASNTLNVSVLHVAPKAIISGAAATSEGVTYTLNLAAIQKGGHAISNWAITWGDGTVQNVAGTQTSVTHSYASGPRRYTISAKATDDVGITAVSNKLSVAVKHAPTVIISGQTAVQEGSTYTLNLGVSGLGNHVIKKWTITWGDGSKPQIVAGNATSATHTFIAKPQTFSIRATMTDDVSTTTSNILVLTVDHLTPVLNLIGASTATRNTDYTLNLSGIEPIASHTIKKWVITWGDGTTTTVTGNPTSVKHKFTTANTFTITAKATDDVGTYDAANTQTVTVS